MEQDTIEIKRLSVNDAAFLSAIAIQAYREHYAHTWLDGGNWYMQTYLSVARLEKELKDANAMFFAVFDGAAAVGFFKLNLNKELPGAHVNGLELERIYLIKSASGKGIGTRLMQEVFIMARQQRQAFIWLKVMDTNPDAVRFYQKAGFAICGTHQVDFVQKRPDMRGMFIMQKQLT